MEDHEVKENLLRFRLDMAPQVVGQVQTDREQASHEAVPGRGGRKEMIGGIAQECLLNSKGLVFGLSRRQKRDQEVLSS